jgi:hypothetical protein
MARLAHPGDYNPASGSIDGSASVDKVMVEPFTHQAKRVGFGYDHLHAAPHNAITCSNFWNGKADAHELAPHNQA